MTKATRRTAMAITAAGIVAGISTVNAKSKSEISKRIEAWKVARAEWDNTPEVEHLQNAASEKDCKAIDAILECPVLNIDHIQTKARWINEQSIKGCLDDTDFWIAQAFMKSFTDIL